MERTGISRRSTLTGAASLGLTLPALAACGDDEPERATDSSSPVDRTSGSDSPSEATSPEPPSEAPSTGEPSEGERGIASTADVPIGGGVVLAADQLVITQPTRGEFKAFTAVCTHQGCTVNKVTDTIDCPCHGSSFSIETGEPVAGPAATPLAGIELDVQGDTITLA